MPTADPKIAASGGNLAPAAPFLANAAAGGNLAPTVPGLTSAVAGGNLFPFPPSTGSLYAIPPCAGVVAVSPVGSIVFASGSPMHESATVIPAGSVNGKTYYTTDGAPTDPATGSWCRIMFSGTEWKYERFSKGVQVILLLANNGSQADPSLAVWPTLGGSIVTVTKITSTAVTGGTVANAGGNLAPTAPGAIL